jgi:membrane fusion protein
MFMVSVMVVTLAFLATASYARKETVSGQLVPVAGSYTLAARMAGTLSLLAVQEGESVTRGQPLATISGDPVLSNGDHLTTVLRDKHEREAKASAVSAAARAAELERQIEEQRHHQTSLTADVERLTRARSIIVERGRLHAQSVAAHRDLEQRGMISPAGLRQHEDAALAVAQQLAQMDREIGLQRSQIEKAAFQIARLVEEVRYAQAQSEVADIQLAERQLNDEARHMHTIVSPIDGTVTALPLKQGNQVVPGQAVAVIVPSAAIRSNRYLEVEVWAPSRVIGLIRPGMATRIMYDSFPYQRFGAGRGVVKQIALSPVVAHDGYGTGSQSEKLYRISVALEESGIRVDGVEPRLAPGMRVTADLVMEEQSLFDLMLGPLRGITQRNVRWP